MIRLVDWAASHTRVVIAALALSVATGILAYTGLPKEGAPDIDFPAIFVSAPFPGISAEDSERLLVKPLENRLKEVDGLDELFSTAADGYAGISLLFEFGLDKAKALAEVRDLVSRAEADLPDGVDNLTVTEFSFSDIPILVLGLAGTVPDRTLMQIADQIKEEIESLEEVLEVGVTGMRGEMVEVIIDPLQLESYGVVADELIALVARNNQLIAAGDVETGQGSFALKIPSTFESPRDVYDFPVMVNAGRVVTLGDLADIRMTFDDRTGIARNNGEATVALQIVKRKGYNVIDTAAKVIETTERLRQSWPPALRDSIRVEVTQNMSGNVEDMVSQLENSILTAVCLVMIVVLAILGGRSALLVGFAIPVSFLLCFSLFALMSIAIANVVMFGLVLAVGMLVDSAIVVVELADRNMKEKMPPMKAYASAAKRMFWPILSSTATTLCAFLPMLFWPGVAGQFMGTLPVTIIFVLSASIVVALVFLPVVGGLTAELALKFHGASHSLRREVHWGLRILLCLSILALLFGCAFVVLNPQLNPVPVEGVPPLARSLPFVILFVLLIVVQAIVIGSLRFRLRSRPRMSYVHRPNILTRTTRLLVGNPIMPVVSILATIAFMVTTFQFYIGNNHGVSFFVDTEPERMFIYVRARGNLSLEEKDRVVRQVENIVIGTEGVDNVFSFSGSAGLSNAGMDTSSKPVDTVGEIHVEFQSWEERQKIGGVASDTRRITEMLLSRINEIPGIFTDAQDGSTGPSSGKPLNLRLLSNNWDDLLEASAAARQKFDNSDGLILVDDTRPVPGIDWRIDIDVEQAGEFGTDVATVGGMVQLITRGLLIGKMRVDSSDEEVEIRVRFPESHRHLSTLDELRVSSRNGLVPLSNFLSRSPVPSVDQISRYEQSRYIDVKADLEPGLTNEAGEPVTPTERINHIDEWLTNEANLPDTVRWKWTGDQEEQEESQRFLMMAFAGALGLMFAVLLAQFNSFYHAVLVLLAVVMSTGGVLLGLVILSQPFSVIMTGIGVVALAGIVVNNNIVLIDTYQENAKIMSRIEAIIRTIEVRFRPVLLTSITTIAGLTPMMLGFSIDIVNGGYAINTPASLWWKSMASAVVFGLATATLLTLIFTPSMLALPIWARKGSYGFSRAVMALLAGRRSRVVRDMKLARSLGKVGEVTILWSDRPLSQTGDSPPPGEIPHEGDIAATPAEATEPEATAPEVVEPEVIRPSPEPAAEVQPVEIEDDSDILTGHPGEPLPAR